MATPRPFDPLREAVQIGVLVLLAVLTATQGASHLTPFLLAAGFLVALTGYRRARAWAA